MKLVKFVKLQGFLMQFGEMDCAISVAKERERRGGNRNHGRDRKHGRGERDAGARWE